MKQAPAVNFLTDRHRAVVAPAPLQKPKKKRTPQLSIRLSEDEHALLKEWAGRQPLGSYVKLCLFKGKKPRKARQSNPVDDFEALARVLSALGRTDVFRNLDSLVRQAENGSLDLSDETIRAVLVACACVTSMRSDLIRALGLREN